MPEITTGERFVAYAWWGLAAILIGVFVLPPLDTWPVPIVVAIAAYFIGQLAFGALGWFIVTTCADYALTLDGPWS